MVGILIGYSLIGYAGADLGDRNLPPPSRPGVEGQRPVKELARLHDHMKAKRGGALTRREEWWDQGRFPKKDPAENSANYNQVKALESWGKIRKHYRWREGLVVDRTNKCMASMDAFDEFIKRGSPHFSTDVMKALKSTKKKSDATRAEKKSDAKRAGLLATYHDKYADNKIYHGCGSSAFACTVLVLEKLEMPSEIRRPKLITTKGEVKKTLEPLKEFLYSAREGMVTIRFSRPYSKNDHVFTLFKCGRTMLKIYQSWVFQDFTDSKGYTVQQHLAAFPPGTRSFDEDPTQFYKEFGMLLLTLVDNKRKGVCNNAYKERWKKLFGKPSGWKCFAMGDEIKLHLDIHHGLDLKLLDRVSAWRPTKEDDLMLAPDDDESDYDDAQTQGYKPEKHDPQYDDSEDENEASAKVPKPKSRTEPKFHKKTRVPKHDSTQRRKYPRTKVPKDESTKVRKYQYKAQNPGTKYKYESTRQ